VCIQLLQKLKTHFGLIIVKIIQTNLKGREHFYMECPFKVRRIEHRKCICEENKFSLIKAPAFAQMFDANNVEVLLGFDSRSYAKKVVFVEIIRVKLVVSHRYVDQGGQAPQSV